MKTLTLVLLISLLSPFLFAQENNNYKTIALSFNFNGLDLSNYYGGVGGRLWISESTVLNASIGGSISEREIQETGETDSRFEKDKYLNIGFGMENHLITSDDLSLYLSTRLSFGFRDEYQRYFNPGSEYSNLIYSYNLGFGLGVEYWIFDRMSFSGQHLFAAYYEVGNGHIGSSATNVQEINGYGLSFGTTSIILSIYF
jgi:hypothetical protein